MANNDQNNDDEEMLDEEGRRAPKSWNDVWNAFINPNLVHYKFGESICDCKHDDVDVDGFFMHNNIIHCADCHNMIAPYKICPHSKTIRFDEDIRKCLLCEKILEYDEDMLYYLKIACTHDFKHVGKIIVNDPNLYNDENDENNQDDRELLDVVKSYCFQCEQYI
jgi:hypothetical protein